MMAVSISSSPESAYVLSRGLISFSRAHRQPGMWAGLPPRKATMSASLVCTWWHSQRSGCCGCCCSGCCRGCCRAFHGQPGKLNFHKSMVVFSSSSTCMVSLHAPISHLRLSPLSLHCCSASLPLCKRRIAAVPAQCIDVEMQSIAELAALTGGAEHEPFLRRAYIIWVSLFLFFFPLPLRPHEVGKVPTKPKSREYSRGWTI